MSSSRQTFPQSKQLGGSLNGLIKILSEATAFDDREKESKKGRVKEQKEETERESELGHTFILPAISCRPASL